MASITRQPTDRKAALAHNNQEPLHYLDVVQTWLSKAITPGHARRLRRLCGDLHVLEEPMRHNPKWVMRLQARQACRDYLEALQKIEASQPILINYVELARDECCAGRREIEALHAHRCAHELRLWHPKRQDTRAYDDSRGNTYDAARKKARVLTRYMEEHCRITGELDCLHSEFRLMGVQSVRRAGIHAVSDLINFDHVQWWQAKTRVVTTPDVERLGRLVRNRRDNTRDRTPIIHVVRSGKHTFTFNLDDRLGTCIMARFDTTQAFVDHFGGVSRLQQAGVFVGQPSGQSSKCDVCT